MPILYQWPQDEDQVVGQPQTTFFAEDQNAEWWVGAFQCAARLAATVVLAIALGQAVQAQALANAHQDDPAGSLFVQGQPDEDFWINPAIPVPASFYVRLPFLDPEEIPALYGQYDEDFWNNPTPPVPASLQWVQQWAFDEQIPAGNLSATVDEYYWQNSAIPVSASLYVRLPLGDPEEIPAGFLSATVDEYYWVNLVVPVSNYFSPFVFSSDEIVVPQAAPTILIQGFSFLPGFGGGR